MTVESHRRWGSLILQGVIGAAVVRLAGPHAFSGMRAWSEGHAWTESLAACAILLALFTAASRGRWRGWLNRRSILRYPPFWVGGGVGFLLLLLEAIVSGRGVGTLGLGPSESFVLPWKPAVLVVAAYAALSVIFLVEPSCKKKHALGSARRDTLPGDAVVEDWAAFRRWMMDDKEIEDPKMDIFGHARVAARIAERLSRETPPTMVLIGPKGSGKSSIARLVENALKDRTDNSQDVAVVRLSVWPFESVAAAVKGILDGIVRELSRHADTLSIADVPRAYVEAVRAAHPAVGAALGLLGRSGAPSDLLGEIENVARAVGMHIVVWIEDLERFDPRLTTSGLSEPEEKIYPIRSLLYLLDLCPSITVVLATESLSSRFDVEKIARFVEHAPRIEPEAAWRFIGLLRRRALGHEDGHFIDPADPEARASLDLPVDPSASEVWFMDLSLDMAQPHRDLGRVLHTPRLLKQALRLVDETWSQLRGEIDFDDVLLITAIRVVRPDVYAFVNSNIDRFRYGGAHRQPWDSDVWKRQEEELASAFELVLQQGSNADVADAVKRLIQIVFSAGAGRSGRDESLTSKPQGFCSRGPVDYWERYSALVVPRPDESDQAVLRAIEQWKAGQPSDLVDRFRDQSTSRPFLNFARLFSSHQLIGLLPLVCDAASRNRAEPGQRYSPGLRTLSGMMNAVGVESGLLCEALENLLARYIPVHLPICHDLVHLFGEEHQNGLPAKLDSGDIESVRKTLVAALGTSFLGKPEQLVFALQGGSPALLYWLCWGLPAIRAERARGIPFDGWVEFSNTLLEAAALSRGTVLPQVLMFISNGVLRIPDEESETPYGAEVDLKAVTLLFDEVRLRDLLVSSEVDASWDERMQQRYLAVKKAMPALHL